MRQRQISKKNLNLISLNDIDFTVFVVYQKIYYD